MNRSCAVLGLALLAASGCTTPRERAEKIAVDTNPLRKSRAGDLCRYRAVRDDGGGTAYPESWTLQLTGAGKGLARVDVAVLGPNRSPPSPSPREPGFFVRMPTADAPLDAAEVIHFFHRPELTSEGVLAVLDRDAKSVEGSTRTFTTVVLDHTYVARELTVTFQDDSLLRGTYRVVFVDDLPVLGIAEAELDEEWHTVDADGQLKTEHRHDKLILAEAHGSTDSR
jgi:hypothetical protein